MDSGSTETQIYIYIYIYIYIRKLVSQERCNSGIEIFQVRKEGTLLPEIGIISILHRAKVLRLRQSLFRIQVDNGINYVSQRIFVALLLLAKLLLSGNRLGWGWRKFFQMLEVAERSPFEKEHVPTPGRTS